MQHQQLWSLKSKESHLSDVGISYSQIKCMCHHLLQHGQIWDLKTEQRWPHQSVVLNSIAMMVNVCREQIHGIPRSRLLTSATEICQKRIHKLCLAISSGRIPLTSKSISLKIDCLGPFPQVLEHGGIQCRVCKTHPLQKTDCSLSTEAMQSVNPQEQHTLQLRTCLLGMSHPEVYTKTPEADD